MTDSSVAANFLQTLDVHRDLSAQVTFYYLGICDNSSQLLHLIVGQILYTSVGINAGFC